jgi:hypothetical protein
MDRISKNKPKPGPFSTQNLTEKSMKILKNKHIYSKL